MTSRMELLTVALLWFSRRSNRQSRNRIGCFEVTASAFCAPAVDLIGQDGQVLFG